MCRMGRLTVVKHEAMEIRASRLRLLGGADSSWTRARRSRFPGRRSGPPTGSGPTARWPPWATLKRDEARALVLQAAGRTYAEIEAETGWSHTKVNRALTEGRAAFRARACSARRGRRVRPLRFAPPRPRPRAAPPPTRSSRYAPTCARAELAARAWPHCADLGPRRAPPRSAPARRGSATAALAPVAARSSPARYLNSATSRASNGTPRGVGPATRTTSFAVLNVRVHLSPCGTNGPSCDPPRDASSPDARVIEER